MRKFIVALLATFLVVSAARGEPLHNFYGEHPEVRDKASFILMLRSSLKVPHDAYVGLFNSQFDSRVGKVATFEQLIQIISTDEFEVRTCIGPIVAYGFRAEMFGTVSRGCYQGELVIFHKRSGLQVFSLYCGNIFQPPAQVVSDCMELVVHLDGGVPTGLQARLMLWGSNTTPACGLRKVQCVECVQPLGGTQPNAMYLAPVSGGVIRLPRAMVLSWTQLCVEFEGYLASDRLHRDKAIRNELASQTREHAKSGYLRVLGETQWLGFVSG